MMWPDMRRRWAYLRKCHEVLQKGQEDKFYSAIALIWQGFMLDLLGKRDEAISVYKKVVEMNINDRMSSRSVRIDLCSESLCCRKDQRVVQEGRK